MTKAKALGQRLQTLRSEAKLKQPDLAALSGVSLRTIQEIESGKSNPEIETITILSDTLKKPLVLFDVDNFVSKEEHRHITKNLMDRHDKMYAQLAELTKKHESLKEQYIDTSEDLKASRREAAALRTKLKSSSLPTSIRKIVSALTALDDTQMELVFDFARGLTRSSLKAQKKIR